MTTLVTAQWVEDRLGTAGFVILDTRSAMRYLQGHLKGAVNLPLRKMRDQDGRVLPADRLAVLFASAGVGDGETPILYDAPDGRNAAMIAWALEYLGRDDVHLMDGFFDGWKAQGKEVFYRPVQAESRQFTPQVNPNLRATLADISGTADLNLVDTRSREEYSGEADTDENPGHIPGAVNIVWQELLGQDGQLLGSGEKAGQVLGEAGITKNDRIVTYCKVGARAALAYLAFKRLGYDVSLYDASYAEWEQSGLPVEK